MLASSPFTELKEASTGAIVGFATPVVLAYALPSLYAWGKKIPKQDTHESVSIKAAGTGGFLVGLGAGLVTNEYLRERLPWLTLAVLGTNLASGFYEYGKTLYEDAEHRVKLRQRDATRTSF